MSSARRVHHTYDQYLRALELSELKLEYCEGGIYAMAGGTPLHAALAGDLIRLLGNALLGQSQVFSSDLEVRIEATDLSTFPDVTVVRGETQLAPLDAHAVTNPRLLVEVTSQSSEDYDRGDKLSHYKQLPSLRAVLLVSHRREQVTVVERVGATWCQLERRAGEDVVLASPKLELPVDEIYRGVTLDERELTERANAWRSERDRR